MINHRSAFIVHGRYLTTVRHLAVSDSITFLLDYDSLWTYSIARETWTSYPIPDSIRESLGWGAIREVIADPIQALRGDQFLVATNGGEWGGTCYRISITNASFVRIDTVKGAIDNCFFVGVDKFMRAWLVGAQMHMGANHSWITLVDGDEYSIVMNQRTRSTRFLPPDRDSSTPSATMLNTSMYGPYPAPTVVIHEPGNICAAAITDSTLLPMYADNGLYSLRYSTGIHQPQARLSKVLTFPAQRSTVIIHSIVDDREGGVIFTSPNRGLIWVRNVYTKPEYITLVS